MPRVFFQRVQSGYRAVRGEMVRQIQLGLKNATFDPGEIDGIYGRDTETALMDFQEKRGLQVSGKVTGETWLNLMKEDPPRIFDRCLQLTSDFEGHGFNKIVGNFDNAGVTWGIIGFTLRHGEIQAIVNTVQQNHPELLDQAFGNLKDELLGVLQKDRTGQLDWANSISLGINKYRVEQPWEEAFSAFGTFPEVQEVQLQRVEKYWDIAQRDSERFGMKTEQGIALCFDIAVQNGGIDFKDEDRRLRRWLEKNPGATDRDRRIVVADVVAENSRPQYIEDVRRRKRTIATGEGEVHRAKYAIRDWGITEFPWKEEALSPPAAPSGLQIIQ